MEKAVALSRRAPLQVCAPLGGLWPRRIMPPRERIEALEIFHPPYLRLPTICFKQRWRAYLPAVQRFFKDAPRPPDVLLLDWVYPDAYAVMEFCRRRGLRIPMIITVHGANALGYFSHARRLEYYAAPLRAAAAVVAVSADLRRRIAAAAGVPEAKIHVIPNGVAENFCVRGPREKARLALGLPLQPPLIVAVARLAPEKALHLLVQALTHLHNRETRLVLIGEGPLRRHLERCARRVGVSERVIFTGGVSRSALPSWLEAADVCALSSLHEGDPVVIREALACGTPVVASRVGGIPEVLSDEKFGLLCEPNDSFHLARRLEEALARTWDRVAISQYGRSHTWDNVAEKLLALCVEVSGGAGQVQAQAGMP